MSAILSSLAFLLFSLAAWAWLSQTVWQATVLLVLVFISKISPWRWQITAQQFHRWGDLASLLTVALLLYAYQNQTDSLPIFVVLKWLPVLFAPVLFTQLFSTQQQIPLGTLFYSFRRREQASASIDFVLPYSGLVLLSAGGANVQDTRYFCVATILLSALLWLNRPRQSSKIAWLVLMSAAVVTSYYGQQGLKRLQTLVEDTAVEWLTARDSDFFKTQTSIGDMGELKLSDSIAFRVQATAPLLLLQASYDRYLGQSWTVSQHTFQVEATAPKAKSLRAAQIQILQTFSTRESLLALPMNYITINNLEGATLQYNPLGTVKISDPPPFAAYQVLYAGKKTDLPSRFDTQIPKQHAAWLKQVAAQWQLANRPPQAIVNAVRDHFHQAFRYSLYLGREANADAALRDFMFKRKAGHCEYFAVATVLLLRQAGIAARLANGYVVEEFDNAQQLYVVRQRHAHAWALAYVDGAWQAVDSTPSQWLALENDQRSWLEPVKDFFSNLLFLLKKYQADDTHGSQNTLWLLAALGLASYIGWRIYSAKAQLTAKSSPLKIVADKHAARGGDSEFYQIEQRFQHTPLARAKNESIQQWVARLQRPELQALSEWHYRLRFDPLGLSAAQRQDFQRQVQQWLDKQV